jgi:hypothetical protein
MAKKFKISICIISMNRLHHVKKTLIPNILNNISYANLEFVLLDYNSSDGLEGWVKANLQHYIDTGVLTYYRTEDPQIFSHSHSKNVAFKLATGDILCNINADHFTGKNFAEYVNYKFQRNIDIFLTPINSAKRKNYNPPRDVLGKVCVKKNDFFNIKGFSEEMIHYGFEDHDFTNRLEMSHLKRAPIKKCFLRFISHEEKERMENFGSGNIRLMLISYISPQLTKFVILKSDFKFDMWTLQDLDATSSELYQNAFSNTRHAYPIAIKDLEWFKGYWQSNIDNSISLKTLQMKNLLLHFNDNSQLYELCFGNKTFRFSEVKSATIMSAIKEFNEFSYNRNITEINMRDKLIFGNLDKFGTANIIKNFDTTKMYTI